MSHTVLVNCSVENCDKMVHVTLTGEGRVVIDDGGMLQGDRLICWAHSKTRQSLDTPTQDGESK